MTWAPVDLTVAAFGVVAVCIVCCLMGTSHRRTLNFHWVLFICLCLPAALYPVWSENAWDKRLRLLIPLIVVVAAVTLITSYRRQQIWVWLQVSVGIILVATGTAAQSDLVERFAGAGSNTIGAGRASGVAVVALVILLLAGAIRRLWLIATLVAIAAWLAFALISTGSRGPVFACAAAILVTAVLSKGQGKTYRVIAASGAVLAGWLVLADATGVGANRIVGSIDGQTVLFGPRLNLWTTAIETIQTTPFGLGWGNFSSVSDPLLRSVGRANYPHNAVLEAFVEAGWLAGACLIVLIARSLVRLRRNATHPYGAALLGIAVFFTINAMVSGDLNDNRTMWAIIAIAWVTAAPPGLERNSGSGNSGSEQFSQVNTVESATSKAPPRALQGG